MNPIIIPTNDELYSTLKIGTTAFPLEIFFDDLNNFYKGFVNWHKQKQIELSYIINGSLKLFTLDGEFILHKHQAFMIPPDKLHSIRPYKDKQTQYFTIIFEPKLLINYEHSFIDIKYYQPLKNSNKSYFLINFNDDLQITLNKLITIFQKYTKPNENDYLNIQRQLQDIWIDLYTKVFTKQLQTTNKSTIDNIRLFNMIDFLQKNYTNKFSLSQMADYVKFSKGDCCRFFKRIMGITISEYLLEYRLKKSIELLKTSDKNITQIANAVGFNSVSDYGAKFKEKTGYTPHKYRKRFLT